MRIISGKAKGHHIKAPKGMSTRPTADKVKEAIFSVLAGHVEDAVVLDAFGGSGGLGLEALSRGASQVVLIDRDRNAVNAMKDNLASTKLLGGQVICGVAETIIPALQQEFSLVFLDPPYNKGHIAKIEEVLLQPGTVTKDVIIVLETNGNKQEVLTSPSWELYKTSVYGDTAVLYYGRRDYRE